MGRFKGSLAPPNCATTGRLVSAPFSIFPPRSAIRYTRTVLQQLVEQLGHGHALSDEQVTAAVGQLIDERMSAETKADFLTALARKGETTGEIAAFARELRDRSIQPPLDAATRAREVLDVCGTGGDRLGTFNISTTVSIIVASAGVTVAKHGNRAITSQAGSADVLVHATVSVQCDGTGGENCRATLLFDSGLARTSGGDRPGSADRKSANG